MLTTAHCSRSLLSWLLLSSSCFTTNRLQSFSRSIVAMADSTVSSGSQQSSSSNSCTSSSVPNANQYLVGYVTISNSELGTELAKKLVNSGLVACVNVIPSITSVYRWQGKLETDSESLLMLKTTADKSDQVVQFVRNNHPYDLPEVIFTPIVQGNPDYLRWISQSVNTSA